MAGQWHQNDKKKCKFHFPRVAIFSVNLFLVMFLSCFSVFFLCFHDSSVWCVMFNRCFFQFPIFVHLCSSFFVVLYHFPKKNRKVTEKHDQKKNSKFHFFGFKIFCDLSIMFLSCLIHVLDVFMILVCEVPFGFPCITQRRRAHPRQTGTMPPHEIGLIYIYILIYLYIDIFTLYSIDHNDEIKVYNPSKPRFFKKKWWYFNCFWRHSMCPAQRTTKPCVYPAFFKFRVRAAIRHSWLEAFYARNSFSYHE